MQEAIVAYNSKTQDASASSDHKNVSASTLTADAATKMVQEAGAWQRRKFVHDTEPVSDLDRKKVVHKAKRCLAWANDPERERIPGADNVTNDQAAAIMLYTQETCLYRRLNAALRNHDIAILEPFLPFMKLLLSGLYQLPLTHVHTYRGVKCELYETYNLLARRVWSWWSFSSTTKDKTVLDTPLFLGPSGKRTLFCINAVGVDIAPFSAMPHEEEVLLLPGLPLVNRPGKHPEPDLWTFEIETAGAFVSGEGESPPVMIDYVHPDWEAIFRDNTWRDFKCIRTSLQNYYGTDENV